MGWRLFVLFVLLGIGIVGATEPHCTTEGRFPNPEECGTFFECLPSEDGGYDLIKDDCKGFLFNSSSLTCSSESCTTRKRRSTAPYHEYSHLCEEKLNGFVCADCRSLVLCVKGQAFVRRCTGDRFCDMRESFGGGVCYPKSPLECSCQEEHKLFRDHYDPQKFFSCADVGSTPTSYRCPDGMTFSEKTLQCRSKSGFPPCTVPGIFANPENCTEYYSCIALRHGWLQKSFTCLNDTLYNEMTGMCVNPCPQGVCKEEGRFPDPLEKSYYYECFLDGGEMKSTRYQCPLGHVWSSDEVQSGHCVLETEPKTPSPFAKCKGQLDMCKDDIVEPPVESCGSNPCYPGIPCTESSIYPFYTCGPCPAGYVGDGVTCHSAMCPYGMTGDGITCGKDTDEDGFPDDELNCTYVKCRRDNCRSTPNPDQNDLDLDGLGDKCDPDADGDGINNTEDNCPYLPNNDQVDQEKDRVGDACDNCPSLLNPGQEDDDQDNVGNVCDTNFDSDSDGVQDNLDNCPNIPNADQNDADADKIGNACDEDADNDGIPNTDDNCVLVPNTYQTNTSSELLGDDCLDDFDGDGVSDLEDHCVYNPSIQKLSYRNPTIVDLLPNNPGIWEVGMHMVTQKKNAAGSMLIAENILGGIDFSGNFRVENPWSNYIGLVFSYQSNQKFYIFLWKNSTTDKLTSKAVQLKVVDSATGPSELLNDAVWKMADTENQTRLIWRDVVETGTNATYTWLVQHRPLQGLMRVAIHQGGRLVVDSGIVMDNTLKGGRVGVFTHSQMGVTFSNFEQMCNDDPMVNRNVKPPFLSTLSASHDEPEIGIPESPVEGLAPQLGSARVLGWVASKAGKYKEAIKWMLKPGNAQKVLRELEKHYPDVYSKVKNLKIWNLSPKDFLSVLAELKKIGFNCVVKIEIVVSNLKTAPGQRRAMEEENEDYEGEGEMVPSSEYHPNSEYDTRSEYDPNSEHDTRSEHETPKLNRTTGRTNKWG